MRKISGPVKVTGIGMAAAALLASTTAPANAEPSHGNCANGTEIKRCAAMNWTGAPGTYNAIGHVEDKASGPGDWGVRLIWLEWWWDELDPNDPTPDFTYVSGTHWNNPDGWRDEISRRYAPAISFGTDGFWRVKARVAWRSSPTDTPTYDNVWSHPIYIR